MLSHPKTALAAPVLRYLNELEIELKQRSGICPEDALSDAREHLQQAYDAIQQAEPGHNDQDIFDHFMNQYGSPSDVAKAYETDNRPLSRSVGYAPGWRICCTHCGASSPAANLGIFRIGAFSMDKFTIGFCRNCRWLRLLRLTKDLHRTSLTRALGASEQPSRLRQGLLLRFVLKLVVLAIVFSILTALDAFGAVKRSQDVPDIFKKMPKGWKLVQSIDVPGRQLNTIGQKLGGKMKSLANTVVSYNDRKIKINTLIAASEKDADQIEKKIRSFKSSPKMVHRDGLTIYEFVTGNTFDDVRLALLARYDFGIQPREVKYQVRFHAAPLKTCDCMKWNRLFNLFLQAGRKESPKTIANIKDITNDFQFSKHLILNSKGIGGGNIEHKLSPSPIGDSKLAGGALISFRVENQTDRFGIPTVEVNLKVTSKAGAMPSKKSDLKKLLESTQRWPVDDPEIQQLAKQIVGDATTSEEKTKAILSWLAPGTNVRFGGKITGSRYGVKRFLDQKFGHCWDFSDAMVTLARASGIPSRQVFGWLHQSEGHVWVEVLTEQGWKHVDPSTNLNCGSDYIPITTSEDGEVPLIYASAVDIKVLSVRSIEP